LLRLHYRPTKEWLAPRVPDLLGDTNRFLRGRNVKAVFGITIDIAANQ